MSTVTLPAPTKRPFEFTGAFRRIRAAVRDLPKAALFELAEDGFDSTFQQVVADRSESSTGALEISTTMSEYRDYAGVKVATVMTQRAAGQEQVLRITGYELNSVDSAVFALPSTIVDLTRQQPATPGR